MAFPTDWGFRVPITIESDDISADLTDWTLVFDQAFASVLTQVDGPLDADGSRASINGGGDIRFSSDEAGTTQIPCDIRYWTTNNTPASATCEVAVKVPAVSSSADTTIYLWWGKSGETQPAVGDTYGQYAAYKTAFVGVYPYSEILPGSAETAKDRTDNQHHARPWNLDDVDRIDSPLGYGYHSDGSPEFVAVDDTSDHSFGDGSTDSPFTVEVLSRLDSVGDEGSFLARTSTNPNSREWGATKGANEELEFWTFDDSSNGYIGRKTSINAISVDTWNHLLFRYDGNGVSSSFDIWVDGIESDSADHSSGTYTAMEDGGFETNAFRSYNGYLTGSLSEVRLYSEDVSDAWIVADYNNQLNISGFLTWGSITDLAGADALDATGIAAGAPVLGSPTIGQEHALDATGIAAGAPVLGIPTIGQEHALDASGIAAGAPVLGTPTAIDIGATHDLTATGIAAGTPVLGTPTIGQEHALDATGIAAGAPVLGTPTIGQEHALDASGIATGTPVLGIPTIGQEHTLDATGIAAGAPVLGTPTATDVAGIHNLDATGIAAGTPVLGSPTIGQEHALDATDTIAGPPVLGTPTIGQEHALDATGIAAGAPVLGTPTATDIGGTDVLDATGIVAGAPVLGTPTIGQEHALDATDTITGPPVLGTPTLAERVDLTATGITTGAPVLGIPTALAFAIVLAETIELESRISRTLPLDSGISRTLSLDSGIFETSTID